MQGEAFAYNLVLHHKHFDIKISMQLLLYIYTHNIFLSSYELSTYTYSFSTKLENWAIPMLSSPGKVSITALNVVLKMKHVNDNLFRHVRCIRVKQGHCRKGQCVSRREHWSKNAKLNR